MFDGESRRTIDDETALRTRLQELKGEGLGKIFSRALWLPDNPRCMIGIQSGRNDVPGVETLTIGSLNIKRADLILFEDI